MSPMIALKVVDLPAPLGPITDDDLPGVDVERDPVQDLDGPVAGLDRRGARGGPC